MADEQIPSTSPTGAVPASRERLAPGGDRGAWAGVNQRDQQAAQADPDKGARE